MQRTTNASTKLQGGQAEAPTLLFAHAGTE